MSVTLHTSLGQIKIELYCELTPRTCKNFLGLAAAGKYDGTSFHRVIKGFIAQGGDTGAGKGGESIYGRPFEDEFHPTLTHDTRGVVAMANKAKKQNSNLSQFYITFDAQPHLNNVNSVFGRVIDGFSVLDALEMVDVGEKYNPVQPIIVESVEIHANPFAELEV